MLRVKVGEEVRCEIKQSSDSLLINIVGEINWYSNNSNVVQYQLAQAKASGITKLKLYLNSPGGDMFEANEIYNLLIAFNNVADRTLEIGAMCCSAATIIAMAFSKQNTSGYSNLVYMIHNPHLSVMDAEVKDLESGIALLTTLKESYLNLVSKRTGLTKPQLSKKMDATWWLSAEECLTYNLIGSKKDAEASMPANVMQVFNKYQFANVPAVLNKLIAPVLEEEEEEEAKPNPIVKPINTMKNFVVLLMASMASVKNYLTNENASEAEVVAALSKAFNEKDTKITEVTNALEASKLEVVTLTAKVKKHNDDMIKALLDVAQNVEQKITADQRKVYEEQAPLLGYEGLSKIINSLAKRTSVKNQLENNGGGNPPKGDDQRVEPEFTKDEMGGRVYNKAGNQTAVMHRMMLERAKQNAGK